MRWKSPCLTLCVLGIALVWTGPVQAGSISLVMTATTDGKPDTTSSFHQNVTAKDAVVVTDKGDDGSIWTYVYSLSMIDFAATQTFSKVEGGETTFTISYSYTIDVNAANVNEWAESKLWLYVGLVNRTTNERTSVTAFDLAVHAAWGEHEVSRVDPQTLTVSLHFNAGDEGMIWLMGGFIDEACIRPTVEWVSDYVDADVDGVPDDQGWIDLLNTYGYGVSVRADANAPQYWASLDEAKVELLNNADLVIVSRAIDGDGYDDAGEPQAWNAVTRPMLLLSPAVATSIRWGILDGATQVNPAAPVLKAVALDHPIFTGVPLDAANQVQIFDADPGDGPGAGGMTTFLDTASAGTGRLIAATAGADARVWIAEWVGGSYYTGSTQTCHGHRMVFFAGTQDSAGSGANGVSVGQGVNNLNPAGQRMFLNAIRYLLKVRTQPAGIVVRNAWFESPGMSLRCWDGEDPGSLDVPGWSSDTKPAKSGIERCGVESSAAAFLTRGDPSLWQVTDYTTKGTEIFELKARARDNWSGSSLRMTLFYDAEGVRVPLAVKDVVVSGAMLEYSLTFDALTLPACAGAKIGIEFANVSQGSALVVVDNVSLVNLTGP